MNKLAKDYEKFKEKEIKFKQKLVKLYERKNISLKL